MFAIYLPIVKFYAEFEYEVYFFQKLLENVQIVHFVIPSHFDKNQHGHSCSLWRKKSHDLLLIRYALFCSPFSSAEANFVVKNVYFGNVDQKFHFLKACHFS